jgi:hypothetical protein
MEIKNEEVVNSEYSTNEDINNQPSKQKKSLSKWGVVGATLVVAGIVFVGGSVMYSVYNSYQGGLEYAVPDISPISISAYNNRWTKYGDKDLTPQTIMSLIDEINIHNSNKQETNDFGEIVIEGINEKNKIKSSSRYKVEIKEYNNIGAVSIISINEQDIYN